MSKIVWDQTGQRRFETGCDRGVLYLPDDSGEYVAGYGWNGLTGVTESPEGAEATGQYADNIKYLNLVSYEEFKATIEAFTYPDEFSECDGTSQPQVGVYVGQQRRKMFGLSYRTLIGNDIDGTDHGYKIHLIYGAIAAPSEKAFTTINDSPEAMTFSWELTTTPVQVTNMKPTSYLCIDSTKVDSTALGALEDMLYGTVGDDPFLPLPDAVIDLFDGTLTLATPTEPTFLDNTITIPVVTGVVYKIAGETVTGDVDITEDTVVEAVPASGYYFPEVIDTDWFFNYTP